MLKRIVSGAVAGAVGTFALDVATYTDMLVRGRASSEVPSKVAGELTDRAGVSLGTDDGQAGNRRSALGAMLGYATGAGVGLVYALAGSAADAPTPAAAALVGGAAMAASDVPATALGATDPSSWGRSGWVSDVVPHIVYGLVTVAVFDWLMASNRRAPAVAPEAC